MTFGVVLITCPKDRAESIARSIVEKRAAACVNIIPQIRSIYWWEDKISTEEEALLIAKTRLDKMEELKKHVKEMHPYAVPEVIALPIVTCLREYLDWIDRETETR